MQTATGLQGGAEAAIHSMKIIFEHEDTEAVILVDASNAFNSLNRQAALHNIQILCPKFSTVLINNTYRIPGRMIVLGSKDILSTEGTTQGDNLAMSFYALGTIPLLNMLQISSPNVSNVCLADDITGAGSLVNLKNWWATIISKGSNIGYYVNESKSWLIVKDELKLDEAKRLFNMTGIKFTTEGKRHLGASIGSEDFRKIYATEKVQEWCDEIEKLSEYAKTQPQAAYAAFCHGEVHKYTYFMRTIPNMDNYLKPLDEQISTKFIPSLLQSITTEEERKFYSLHIRFGGLGIPIISETAIEHYNASKKITAPLVSLMLLQGNSLPDKKEIKELKLEVKKQQENLLTEKVKEIDTNLSSTMSRAMSQARKKRSV